MLMFSSVKIFKMPEYQTFLLYGNKIEKRLGGRTGQGSGLSDEVSIFLVQHRTEIMDAGMSIRALVYSIPMPSCAMLVCD
jgi:hypothetical protein